MTKTQVISDETVKEMREEVTKKIEENKSNYKIEMEHLYLLSQIADKINFEFPEFPDYDSKREEMENDKKTKKQIEKQLKKMQGKYGKDIMLGLFKSMYKAKQEINELISSITKKNVKEMSLKEVKDSFMEILNTDGVLDFFR